MSLVVAVWSEDATRSANETVHARLTRLHNQVTLVLRRTSPTFMVFMASEFLFMHAHPAGAGLRWYSKNERDEALRGIAATSRLFGRLLLVGGSICWAKPVSHVFGKTEWRVRNQVPVCYGGKLISLYGKRLEGGEVNPGDALRIHQIRRGAFNQDMYERGEDDISGNRQYRIVQATGNLGDLASMARNTVKRGPGGAMMLAAPGINAAKERYEGRIRFVPGADEPSFFIPGGKFTAGVEVCQEHNQGLLKSNSELKATNFHLLTSNTVSHQVAQENLREPGLLVHAKAGCAPELITLIGTTRTVVPDNQWTAIHERLHFTDLAMPTDL